MYQEVFLISLALIWVLFASLQDIKKRIVSDWLNFSFIIFVFGFRFFYSLFELDGFFFFYQGIVGFLIFLLLGNALYYAKFFGGGDAKLMIALGAVLPLTDSILSDLEMMATFFVIFLLVGSFYGLFWSVGVVFSSGKFKTYGKDFKKQFKKAKALNYFSFALGIVLISMFFFEQLFLYLGILVLLIPLLYIHSKTIDDSFLIKRINTSSLEEGDWIFRDVKIKGKIINPSWPGLTKVQIREIKKTHKTIQIRYGIPFVPVFFISLAILVYFFFSGIGLNFP
ncbi:MAG: prepilin peptidase [Candidatus Pacearchaeota archaeon]